MNTFTQKRFILILLVVTMIFSKFYYLIHGLGSAIFVGLIVFTGGYFYKKLSIKKINK